MSWSWCLGGWEGLRGGCIFFFDLAELYSAPVRIAITCVEEQPVEEQTASPLNSLMEQRTVCALLIDRAK